MSSRSDIRSSCVERFLRYVTLDTRSEEDQEAFPSTSKQLDLLRLLVDELKGIGLLDASIDEHGYVFATIPATTKKAGVPVLGFIAHVDTSPEVSGSGVKPIVHPRYDGRDLALPGDPTQVIRLAENPALRDQMGNDIITASGTTLLGADNKAGVAEIVGVAEVLIAHPEIPHGRIRIGFTPDEEVGNGTKFFDVARFGAQFAYTIDGETLGEIEMETFSADSMTVTFQGFNTHPGLGKGKLVNAIKIAADFIGRLPKDGLSPETTEGYEGYVHPYVMQGGVDRTSVKFLIRDFVTAGLKGKEDLLERLARETVRDVPNASVEFKIEESYRNMKEVLDRHPETVEHANEAIRRAGLVPKTHPIRGGTDGSRLCFMGLPTPNLFAGEHNFHSRLEWISAQDMHKAVEVIVNLCRVWEERSPA
ncbi:MAG: peptidase T [Acidobacteriia bacterium]|nr:peptidase T [Terriglobia bacterium]